MVKVQLNNGIEMPQLGYGVFQITDLEQCGQCVRDALETGYRLMEAGGRWRNCTVPEK